MSLTSLLLAVIGITLKILGSDQFTDSSEIKESTLDMWKSLKLKCPAL